MWPSTRTAVTFAAAAAFGACAVLPVGYLLVTALPAGIDNVTLPDARQRHLLLTTMGLGLGTCLLSTVIGVPLGVALARIAFPFKPLVRILLGVPVLLPPYVVALAWIYLGGSRGVVATVTGHDLLSGLTFSLPGAVLVLSAVFYPLSMLATEVGLRRIDGRLEEAGLLAASPGRVLRDVTLPLAGPPVAAAALVIYVLAVAEFGVPGLLRVPVYATEVFTAFASLYDFGRALVLAMPLLLVCLLVAVAAAAVFGERLVAGRRSVGTPAIPLEWLRVPAALWGVAIFTGALVLPLAILAREAAGARSLATVFAGSGGAIVRSLVVALAGATVTVTVAVWLGYARARSGRRLGVLVDAVFIGAFAVPATIVGVGLIGLWNRPGPLGAAYGTDLMYVIVSLARCGPVAALILAASIRYIPSSQEEAAAVGGAGWLRTMASVILPQLGVGLAAAWTITFVLTFGELGASILVAPPGGETLPIRIYTIVANTPASHVAALALLQAAVVLLPVAGVATALARRDSR